MIINGEEMPVVKHSLTMRVYGWYPIFPLTIIKFVN